MAPVIPAPRKITAVDVAIGLVVIFAVFGIMALSTGDHIGNYLIGAAILITIALGISKMSVSSK